jgi:AAA domain/DnaB-like helicase N terminal domain
MNDTPPHDIASEQAVLGAVLSSANAGELARQALGPADFYRPQHQDLFSLITTMMRNGEPVDAVTVRPKLELAPIRGVDAPYLFKLIQSVPSVANVGYYATIVRGHAVRRRLIEAGHRVVQLALAEAESGIPLVERAISELERVRASGLGDGVTAQTYREFLSAGEIDDPYDWVVPGLLERGDRLVVTGTSGIGKSTLYRQMAVCAAAGIHPFTSQAVTPVVVLLIDCENGPAHIRRKLRPLIHQAAVIQRPVADTCLWIESRVDGIDLAVDRDVSWLLRQVAGVHPDILAIGPLYRLAPRALNDDTDVAPVLNTLNLIRGKGVTILLEAHHGRGGDMAPRGSSALTNFPEFGLGLRPSQDANAIGRTADLVHWRGDRDERNWPRALAAGGHWPWSAYTPTGNGSW